MGSCAKSLQAALASLEEEGESKGANYDMVATFCLQSWTMEGDSRAGLMGALDVVATALSYGHRPSVRTFNSILDAFAACGNPDIPHPSAAYTEAMRRCVQANTSDRPSGGGGGM